MWFKNWRRRYPWRWRIILVALIAIVPNATFWFLVWVEFPPVRSRYEQGRIVRVGSMAFIFGHGEWVQENGIEKHYTTALSSDTIELKRPTLEVIRELQKDGVRWIWGSWCYSGDHDYIEKNHNTGEEILWPSYVSRNENKGETLPVWLGLGIVRVSISSPHTEEPVLPFAKTNGIRPEELLSMKSPLMAFPYQFPSPALIQ